MIQSSTSPWCTTMLGTSEPGSNAAGVCPSTVMKNLVALLGLFGSESSSEKKSLRTRTGATLPSHGRRGAGNGRGLGRGYHGSKGAVRVVLAPLAGIDGARHEERLRPRGGRRHEEFESAPRR